MSRPHPSREESLSKIVEPSAAEQEHREDEIDLRQILRTVLRTRRIWFIAMVAISALFWVMVTMKYAAIPAVHSYTKTFQLVFPGLNDGRYPNGTPFSIEDVISANVIGEVYESLGLKEYFGSRDAFARSFRVTPYAPDQDVIMKKFQASIDPKKMTVAEMEAAQQRLRRELQQASSTAVALSFSISDRIAFPESKVSEVLDAVPSIWAKQAIDRRGVIKLDVPIYSEKIIDDEVIKSLEYLIVFDYLVDKVKTTRDNLRRLAELPNAETVRDDSSGFNLADLERAVDDLERFSLANLMVPLHKLRIAKNPEVVQFYFENKLTDLTRQQQELINQSEVVKKTYAMYTRTEKQAEAIGEGGSPLQPPYGQYSTLIPQLGDNFLDRLLELSNKGSDIEFRQELTRKMLEFSEKATVLDTEISRVQEIITAFRTPGEDKNRQLRDEYLRKVEQELPQITDKLRFYLTVTRTLYSQLSKENFGYTGMLYRESGSSFRHNVDNSILNKTNLRWYLIVLFLTTLLVVPAVMLRNAMRAP